MMTWVDHKQCFFLRLDMRDMVLLLGLFQVELFQSVLVFLLGHFGVGTVILLT